MPQRHPSHRPHDPPRLHEVCPGALAVLLLWAGLTACQPDAGEGADAALEPVEPSWAATDATPEAHPASADAGPGSSVAEGVAAEAAELAQVEAGTGQSAPTGLDPLATEGSGSPVAVPEPHPSHPTPSEPGAPPVLDGRWIGGPAGAPDLIIEVGGTLVTARRLDSEESEGTLFEVTSAEGGHVTLRAAREGNIVEVHALFLSANEALVWVTGEGEPQLLRRVGEMPAALLGEWEGVVAGDGQAPERVVIEADAVNSSPDMQRTPLYPLAGTGETLETVGVPSVGVPRIVRFRTVDSGAVLSWSDEGQVALLYRPGSPPAWLSTLLPADAAVAPTDPTLPVDPTDPTDPLVPPTPGEDEGVTQLRRLADLAVTYFMAEHVDSTGVAVDAQFPPSTTWTPTSEDCPLGPTDPAAFATPTWQALAFAPGSGSAYQYRFITTEFVTFEVQARIDRDCDGVYHKLSIAGFMGGEPTLEDLVEENPGE